MVRECYTNAGTAGVRIKPLATRNRAARKALYLYVAKCMAEDPYPYGELISSQHAITRFGVTNQQLNAWRRNNQLIFFGLSRKNRRFPSEQFCQGGNIVPGIDQLVPVIGTGGKAWLFLIQPLRALNDERPLDLLKDGKIKRVIRAAERYFDVLSFS
jgi:hypothetical protein